MVSLRKMGFRRNFFLPLLVALVFTAPGFAELGHHTRRGCPFSRLAIPEGRKVALHDLRLVWSHNDLRSTAERFITNGVLIANRELGDAFLAEVNRLIEVSPRLTSPQLYAGLRKFLDGRRADFNAAFERDDRGRILSRLDQVKRMVKIPPESILDIGAGDGQIVTALGMSFGLPKEKIFATEVADYTGVAAATWLKYEPNGSIPLKENSVDLATIFMVLHHTENPAAIVDEAFRVLKTGGTLIVRETDAVTLKDKLFNRTMDTMFYEVFSDVPGVPLPHNYKSRSQWRTLFKERGFEVASEIQNEQANPFTPVFFVLRKP